ncbi:MAG: hypothetical protein F4X76_10135 [Chloroflexi bacterium]|nr:hypothetical protein [Chloroflexota bacterium]
MSKANQVEAAIRAAMDRLLKGEPIRSDGSLTAVALAAESGVSRWKLYDEYRYLLDEFGTRAALQDNTPRALRDLQEKHAQLKERHIRTRNKLAQSAADVKRLSCVVNVLALENAKCKENHGDRRDSDNRPDRGGGPDWDDGPDSNVTPISRAKGFSHDTN